MTESERGTDSAPDAGRPASTQPRLILLVLLGGAIGTAGRAGIVLALPTTGGVPWAVAIVNIGGAFLLGFLVTALRSRSPETAARRDIRVFVGTGILGGFTTYSALATDAAALLEADTVVGVAYALGSVVTGLAAAAFGILLAGWAFRGHAQPEATT